MPERRRLPAEARRAQIVETAKALFVEVGVAHTSMRAIAAKLSITPAAIYQHFRDKDAILHEIAQGFFEGFIQSQIASLEGIDDRIARLKSSLTAYIDYGLAHPIEYRLVFMTPIMVAGATHRRTEGDDASPLHNRGIEAFDLLRSGLAALMDTGIIAARDPDLAAETVWASIHGLVCLLITHREFPFCERSRLVQSQIDLIVDGLKASGQNPALPKGLLEG